jgi:hypothetical protein
MATAVLSGTVDVSSGKSIIGRFGPGTTGVVRGDEQRAPLLDPVTHLPWHQIGGSDGYNMSRIRENAS